MLRFLLLFLVLTVSSLAQAREASADTTRTPVFTEGVMQTRITFPGNPINELLLAIDLRKGDVQEQLKTLYDVQQSEAYALRVKALIDKMSAEEQQAMGFMMMAALMSPLYATIYFDNEKALAKAYALNYTLESFMNTAEGKGKMVAVSNDKNNAAAIQFSARSLKDAWQKETADAEHYDIQWLKTSEKVGDIVCQKVIYSRKAGGKDKLGKQMAYKLIAWYSPQVSNRINFAHPFYLDIPHGVLKIEVHYDKAAKNRLVYEVTQVEQKKLAASHFKMTDIQPVIDWDANQVQASMNMLNVFMSQSSEDE